MTVSNTPCALSPSMTVDETPAACARPERVQAKPSSAGSSTRRARRRSSGPARFRAPQPFDPWLRDRRRRRPQHHARHHAGAATACRWRSSRRNGACPASIGGQSKTSVDRPQLLRIDLAGIAVPDDARDLARPERHAHDRARLDIHAVRHRIGVWPLGRHRHQDRRRRLTPCTLRESSFMARDLAPTFG